MTVLLASAVPLKVGVVSLVTLSLLLRPVSEPLSKSIAPGAEGAVVSIVTDRGVDAAPVLPAPSVTLAVKV